MSGTLRWLHSGEKEKMATPGNLRRWFARPEGLMLAALSAGAITLAAAAAIGGRGTIEATGVAGPGGGAEADDYYTEGEGPSDEPGEAGPEATSGPGVKTPTDDGGGPVTTSEPGTTSGPPKERQSTQGATREGVFTSHFEMGSHAPITFDGAPLPLAEDPVIGLKGYITYVNRKGGINGLKIQLHLIDDRYTTAGGKQAGDRLAKEIKPFFIEGTLGIDQIHKVLLAAKGAGIPYFAGGGPEPEFKDLGMYQIISNYDQYVGFLADFICSSAGKKYMGNQEIRLGTTTLNSTLILPVEKRFVAELEKRKCVKTPVDPSARTTIQKPTEQDTYQQQFLRMKQAYDGQGVNLIVPLQDPITTTRQLLEWQDPTFKPKWTFANFAHDSDTVLVLAKGQFTGFQGLSGGCYYHPDGGGKPYDPNLCAKMGEAHRQWVSLGPVTYDQNAGGSVGGKSSYTYDEDSWKTDGSGGASGYQLVYFWHGAMKSIGTDPTREKFMAALSQYNNYSDLITGPITFAGSPNKMIGAKRFTLWEAKSNLKYRQVTEVTPGLVDQF